MTDFIRRSLLHIGARVRSDVPGRDRHNLARVGFFDADRHSDALALLCAEALKRGPPDTAFMFADRKCRLSAPTAYDLTLRALASRLMNEIGYAQADLARAFEIDPMNDLVIANVLDWGDPALQPIAAATLLEGESQDLDALRLAMQVLSRTPTPIVSRLRVREGMHEGWVAWRGEAALELVIQRSGGRRSFDLHPDTSHPLACREWSTAQIAIELESPRLEAVTFRLDGDRSHTLFPPPRRSEQRFRAGKRALRPPPSELSHHVEVLVPVYRDYAATRACLDALESEGSAKHVTVIDDCSPDADIRALVEDRAARGLFTLVRNEENLGFARSVNRVLGRVAQGDVLLMNADTILPRKAIGRLALAAYSESRVATVTPLSNNGEYASFPKPNICNALPPIEEICALDGIANGANGRGVVDLPSGVGFCLFITRACLDEVGLLSEAYSRGYYEDVDFCLRAREIGFRNVCATGVYVGHAGNRSFQDEKRRLVVRNLKILQERFPRHEIECAAFVKADPLRSARARLEERLASAGHVVLLFASASTARPFALERARQIERQGHDLHCICCEVSDSNDCVTLKSIRGDAPQSLTFALNDEGELARLRAYLVRIRAQGIEIIAPHSLPDPALRAVLTLRSPIRAVFGDLDWLCDRSFVFEKSCPNIDRPGECDACANPARPSAPSGEGGKTESRRRTRELVARADAIVPIDRMAAAFCAANLESVTLEHSALRPNKKADTVKPKRAGTTLGVLCPEATADADRQLEAIERVLDERGLQGSIVVLGRCVNELGVMSKSHIFVSGNIEDSEYERALDQYRVTHLLSPYRTRHFGLVDRLSSEVGIPKGYFDWSFGALEREAGDLALDPRICFERAALEIAAWLVGSGGSASPPGIGRQLSVESG
jgi:GT2 family glycosyltransferase